MNHEQIIANTNLIWSLLCSKATAVKQESNGVEIHRLSVTVCIHKLFQLSASLDPEENFIAILKHPTFHGYFILMLPHEGATIQSL